MARERFGEGDEERDERGEEGSRGRGIEGGINREG